MLHISIPQSLDAFWELKRYDYQTCYINNKDPTFKKLSVEVKDQAKQWKCDKYTLPSNACWKK